MNELNIKEIFCETLSGFIAFITCLLLLDFTKYFDLNIFLILFDVTLPNIIFIAIISYFIGLIIDAIGLSVGEIFLDNIFATENTPTTIDYKIFNKKVTEHILKYRDDQWTYYSLYRNIFIIMTIALPFYSIKIFKTFDILMSFILIFIYLLILCSLLYASRTLINMYYNITKNID